MKKLIKILSIILLFTAAQSCTDLLKEPSPSTATTQQVALGTASGVKATRAYMYSILHDFTYTTAYMLTPSILADGLFTRFGLHRLALVASNAPGEHVIEERRIHGQNGYYVSYNLINQANILIDAIEPGVLPDALLKQYRGEAFFMRAFAMHHLVRTFGYEPGVTPNFGQGEGWNVGIVIRTDPVLSLEDATFKPRSPVLETYKQIESDLLRAVELLSQGDADVPYYATQAAAVALLARVYLYWRKYDLADKYATLALQHSPARLANTEEVGTLFNVGTTIEVIFQTVITNPATESVGSESLAAQTSTVWVSQVPTQDIMDLYSINDARLAWFGLCFDNSVDKKLICLATHPAIQNGEVTIELQKWNGDLGNFADNVPLLRAAEMVLIQAEARLQTQGPAAAVARLNDLRISRGIDKYSGPLTFDAVLQAILTERRREFIGEGHRFFDLKRLGMDIRKAPGLRSETVANVPFADYRVLNNIPYGEVALSRRAVQQGKIPQDSVLTQNPGY